LRLAAKRGGGERLIAERGSGLRAIAKQFDVVVETVRKCLAMEPAWRASAVIFIGSAILFVFGTLLLLRQVIVIAGSLAMLCYYIINLRIYLAFAVIAGLALLGLWCARHVRRASQNHSENASRPSKPCVTPPRPKLGSPFNKVVYSDSR
jgi:hypothetical protein